MKFPNAAKGVKKIFTAEILLLFAAIAAGISAILMVTIFASVAAENDNATAWSSFGFLLLSTAMLVLLIVGGIMAIVGYFQAAKDESSFKNAIICAVISIVVGAVAVCFQASVGFFGWLGTVLNLTSQVFQLFIVIFAIGGIMSLAEKYHREDIVQKGVTLLNIIKWLYILYFIVLILSRVLRETAVTGTIILIISVVSLILSVVQYILYLSYLSKASKMLQEN